MEAYTPAPTYRPNTFRSRQIPRPQDSELDYFAAMHDFSDDQALNDSILLHIKKVLFDEETQERQKLVLERVERDLNHAGLSFEQKEELVKIRDAFLKQGEISSEPPTLEEISDPRLQRWQTSATEKQLQNFTHWKNSVSEKQLKNANAFELAQQPFSNDEAHNREIITSILIISETGDKTQKAAIRNRLLISSLPEHVRNTIFGMSGIIRAINKQKKDPSPEEWQIPLVLALCRSYGEEKYYTDRIPNHFRIGENKKKVLAQFPQETRQRATSAFNQLLQHTFVNALPEPDRTNFLEVITGRDGRQNQPLAVKKWCWAKADKLHSQRREKNRQIARQAQQIREQEEKKKTQAWKKAQQERQDKALQK